MCSLLQEFIQTKGYPSWTNVTCVREGSETPLFKQNFTDWLNKGEVTTPLKVEKKAAGEYSGMLQWQSSDPDYLCSSKGEI